MSGFGRGAPSPESAHDIGLAAAGELHLLPDIERRACELFRTVPATAALPLYLTGHRDFEAAQRADLLWVARFHGQPVGFALVEPLDGGLHLEELDVLPEHGGRGVGRALVETVIHHAEAHQKVLTLCTFRDVPWNAPWYARLGFRELSSAEQWPGLAARVAEEAAHGLPPALRVVMQHET